MENRARHWLAAVAIAAALSAGCSGDDDDGHPGVITDPIETTSSTSSSSTTSSSTTTTVDPDAAVKAEIEARYLAYWDAWLEIFAEPNPENPLIDEYTTLAVREVTLDAISEDILNGTSVRPPENPDDFAATVLSVTLEDGPHATVRACLVDGSLLVKNETDEILTDTLVTLMYEATVVEEDGRWKVAGSRTVEKREGRWTCDDD